MILFFSECIIINYNKMEGALTRTATVATGDDELVKQSSHRRSVGGVQRQDSAGNTGFCAKFCGDVSELQDQLLGGAELTREASDPPPVMDSNTFTFKMQEGRKTPEGTSIFSLPHIVVGVPTDERDKLTDVTAYEGSIVTHNIGCNVPEETSLGIAHAHGIHTIEYANTVFTDEFNKLGKPDEDGDIKPLPTMEHTMSPDNYWSWFLNLPLLNLDPDSRHPRMKARNGEDELLEIEASGKNKNGFPFIPAWNLENPMSLPVEHCTILFGACITRVDSNTFEYSGMLIRDSTYENPVTKIDLSDSTLFRYDFKHIKATNPYPWVTDKDGKCSQALSFYFSTKSEFTVTL
jgi:hypothetical protein